MNEQKIGIPGAIIIAGLLIAGAVIFAFSDRTATLPSQPAEQAGAEAPDDFRYPSDDDHTRGAENPTVTIVEYSDIECPYCGAFHPTLKSALKNNPDVAWTYRHFPLNSIHPQATPAAVASECVADLAGEDAFWSFIDTMYEDQSKLSADHYVDVAASLGVNTADFNACLTNPDIITRVNDDLIEVTQLLGGRGTPFSVVVTADGNLIPLSGNQGLAQVQAIIDQAREN